MKKIVAMLLCAAMVLSLAACGSKPAATTTTTPAATTTAKPADGTTSAATDIAWPKETITLVCPYSAGGDTDTYARQLAAGLTKELGVNVIVTNTTGGSGVVASTTVHDAKADGYTLLFHHTGVMMVQEAVEQNDFSFLTDFEVVSTVARDDTYTLVVLKDSPFKTIPEFIDYAKANPGKVKFSITLNGATHAVSTAMEKAMGVEMDNLDVGSSAADRMTALRQKQCDLLVINYMNIKDFVENGDFVVLGVLSNERLKGLDQFPTLKEQGYDITQPKQYEVRAPKGTDPAIVAKLDAAIAKVVTTDDFATTLAKYFAEPFYRNGADTVAQDTALVAELKEFFGV